MPVESDSNLLKTLGWESPEALKEALPVRLTQLLALSVAGELAIGECELLAHPIDRSYVGQDHFDVRLTPQDPPDR